MLLIWTIAAISSEPQGYQRCGTCHDRFGKQRGTQFKLYTFRVYRRSIHSCGAPPPCWCLLDDLGDRYKIRKYIRLREHYIRCREARETSSRSAADCLHISGGRKSVSRDLRYSFRWLATVIFSTQMAQVKGYSVTYPIFRIPSFSSKFHFKTLWVPSQ